jgi:hypothetical protein
VSIGAQKITVDHGDVTQLLWPDAQRMSPQRREGSVTVIRTHPTVEMTKLLRSRSGCSAIKFAEILDAELGRKARLEELSWSALFFLAYVAQTVTDRVPETAKRHAQ